MALFKTEDLKDELLPVEKLESGKVVEIPTVVGMTSVKIGKVNEKLERVMGDWDMKTDLHYVSHGHWSLHNVLEWLLPKIGASDIYIATWSLSEDATRCIINLCETGLIKSLYGILDYRAKNRHEAAYYLAKSHFAKIHTTACHAKVTVIRNDSYKITINGSANYTNNPRIESGVISVSETVADFHIRWMDDVINKVSVFD